jgi:protein gp37
MANRYGKVKWGPEGVRVKTSAANWKKPMQWQRQAEKEGVRYRVFCASLADVFEDKPDQRKEMDSWRVELFRLIEKTPNLDWLLLTKRPNKAGDFFRMLEQDDEGRDWCGIDLDELEPPFKNVWFGTSVENQEQADKRIPELLRIPARGYFLSCEPLLEKVNILPYLWQRPDIGLENIPQIVVNWVIVGGESGKNARPLDGAWVLSLLHQCKETNTPFLFKQWGEWFQMGANGPDDVQKGDFVWERFTDGSAWVSRRVGKKTAGRMLFGTEHNELPHFG